MKKNSLLEFFKKNDLLKILSISAILCGAMFSLVNANNSVQKWINDVNLSTEQVDKNKSEIKLLQCEVAGQKTDIEVVKSNVDLILKNQESQDAFLRQIVMLLKR